MNEDVYSLKYESLKFLRCGNFGSISESRRIVDGRETITKVVTVDSIFGEWVLCEKQKNRQIPSEIHFLERLEHPNIIKFIEYFQTKTSFIIVTEKRNSGIDLFEFINKQPKLEEKLTAHIFSQVLSAVAYLHSRNILHGDIKEENVVIDRSLNCVLIDFGSSAYFGPDVAFSSYSGSPQCICPEVLRREIFRGPEQEVWCLGVLLYTLLHFDYPFHSDNDILNSNLVFNEEISQDMQEVLLKCLHPIAVCRPAVSYLANVDLFKQPIELNLYTFYDIFDAGQLTARMKN
ncbi:unnamed protein product [Auanema sp. JU1783]|nr:unnamed protein product [Auanema sp. JU1783]